MLTRENPKWKLSPVTVRNSDALKFVLLMDWFEFILLRLRCANVSRHTVFARLKGTVHPKLKYNPFAPHPDVDGDIF